MRSGPKKCLEAVVNAACHPIQTVQALERAYWRIPSPSRQMLTTGAILFTVGTIYHEEIGDAYFDNLYATQSQECELDPDFERLLEGEFISPLTEEDKIDPLIALGSPLPLTEFQSPFSVPARPTLSDPDQPSVGNAYTDRPSPVRIKELMRDGHTRADAERLAPTKQHDGIDVNPDTRNFGNIISLVPVFDGVYCKTTIGNPKTYTKKNGEVVKASGYGYTFFAFAAQYDEIVTPEREVTISRPEYNLYGFQRNASLASRNPLILTNTSLAYQREPVGQSPTPLTFGQLGNASRYLNQEPIVITVPERIDLRIIGEAGQSPVIGLYGHTARSYNPELWDDERRRIVVDPENFPIPVTAELGSRANHGSLDCVYIDIDKEKEKGEGQVPPLGDMDSSGASAAPHLHFELAVSDEYFAKLCESTRGRLGDPPSKTAGNEVLRIQHHRGSRVRRPLCRNDADLSWKYTVDLGDMPLIEGYTRINPGPWFRVLDAEQRRLAAMVSTPVEEIQITDRYTHPRPTQAELRVELLYPTSPLPSLELEVNY